MDVEWTRRERNQEADDLSNLLTSSFDPHEEVKINLKGQSWQVSSSTPRNQEKTNSGKKKLLHGRRRKRKKEDKLKFREKW